ncbi:MAG: glycoside hydrolase family 31 protein [Bacillota bacterium]|nr:glycoside hydrolase family 31 protein [Bacillota bacterium]
MSTMTAAEARDGAGRLLRLEARRDGRSGPAEEIELEAATPHVLRLRWRRGGSGRLEPLLDGRPVWLDPGFRPRGRLRRMRSRDGWLGLSTGALRLELQPEPFALRVRDRRGRLVADFGPGALEEAEGELRLRMRALPGERYVGLGEKVGFLDHRGKRLEEWCRDVLPHLPDTDPLYQAIPFLMVLRPVGAEAARSVGLFLASTWRTSFDLAARDPEALRLGVDARAGGLELWLVAGPEPAAVLERYTELTGRTPLPPLWALGYHQSRYSYYPEPAVRELARGFRERGIPCDAIHLDIHYMDGYRVFTWDPERFPEPERMARDLARDGFHLVTILDPGVKVDPDYRVYREGLERDVFCRTREGEVYRGEVWPGTTAFPDFARPEVRRWWGDLHRGLLDRGVDGIWNDMNEPAVFDGPGKSMPEDVTHRDERGRTLPHAAVHNAYALLEAEATRQGMLRARPDERPFLLTRAGFAGIQRYAAVWTGDNASWWEHLQMATPMLLGLSLSGVPFAGTDIGGFLGDSSPELYARWIELGAFSPFCRTHTALDTRAQEPWSFGPEVEAIARRYIRLRYRLLPYLYALFREAERTGLPPLRPLWLVFPEDPGSHGVWDQFLLGEQLLLAPVDRPGARRRPVHLPPGRWREAWSGRWHRGPADILVEAPLDRIPAFIREGAVLPLGPAVAHTGELADPAAGPLEFHAYPGPRAGSGRGPARSGSSRAVAELRPALYEDDGRSFAYRRGEWRESRLTLERLRPRAEGAGEGAPAGPATAGREAAVQEALRVRVESEGRYASSRKERWLVLHDAARVLGGRPEVQPGWRYDEGEDRLWVPLPRAAEAGEAERVEMEVRAWRASS